MSAFTKAVFDRLAGDTTLTDLLTTYFGQPAIFTVIPIPENAELPYIVTEGNISEIPFDTKVSAGREVFRDVRCYTEATGSSVEVELIAERVRTLFHQHALAIEGFENAFLCHANSIMVAPGEDGAYGRIVTIRFITMEES